MPPAVAIAESGSGGEGANAAAAQKDGEEKLVPTLLQPATSTTTTDTATNTTTTTSETALPSKRKRKTRQADPYFIHEPVKRKTVAKKKKKLNAEEEFASFWICSECKEAECMMKPEADKLLICEGACRRLFHYPCAGLSELPAEDESYVCGDCQSDKHPCSFCHCYGVDNEDVFLCSKDGCGLFFHESCLSMQNVEVERSRVEETESPSEDVGVGESDDAPAETCRFVCPAHSCWTCTQKDAKEQEHAGKGAPKKKGRKKKSKGNGSAFDCKSDSMLTVSAPPVVVFLVGLATKENRSRHLLRHSSFDCSAVWNARFPITLHAFRPQRSFTNWLCYVTSTRQPPSYRN